MFILMIAYVHGDATLPDRVALGYDEADDRVADFFALHVP